MSGVINRTKEALTKIGERIERRLSTGDDEYSSLESAGPSYAEQYPRPLDGYDSEKRASRRNSGVANRSSDNLAAGGYGQMGYGGGAYDQMGYGGGAYGQMGHGAGPYGQQHFGGGGFDRGSYGGAGYGQMHHGGGLNTTTMYGSIPPRGGNIAYAPNYYVAERREIDLVPIPPPRIIRQPVPYPVDRPVPRPYPVPVPQPVPVDRPVPVPVPSPVPVPVPVPSPVPCYVPVGIPVPSPRASPVMIENSVTHSQRWVTGSPVMMNSGCVSGFGGASYGSAYGNYPIMR